MEQAFVIGNEQHRPGSCINNPTLPRRIASTLKIGSRIPAEYASLYRIVVCPKVLKMTFGVRNMYFSTPLFYRI